MSSKPVALVTGASRGIGMQTAVEFAKRGYDVAITARGEDGLKQTAQRIEDAGGEALLLPGDLSDMQFIQSIVPSVVGHFGKINVVVNNAAWREIGSIRHTTPEVWDKTLRVMLTAPAFIARDAANDMEERNIAGVIINISSVQSKLASGVAAAYVPAKGAIDALTYELAVTYGSSGIRAVAVNPGAIDTEMSGDYANEDGENVSDKLNAYCNDLTPLRRAGKPVEIAKTIAFLASEDAGYITGTTIFADGGMTQQLYPYSLKHLLFPEEYQ